MAKTLNIGAKIKAARRESGKSQTQVGIALGVSDKTISGYEASRITPPLDKLLDLAEYLQKPISYFLSDDTEQLHTVLFNVQKSVENLNNSLAELDRFLQNEKN